MNTIYYSKWAVDLWSTKIGKSTHTHTEEEEEEKVQTSSEEKENLCVYLYTTLHNNKNKINCIPIAKARIL